MGEADEGGGVDDEDGGKESGDVEGVGVAFPGIFLMGGDGILRTGVDRARG